MEDMEGKHRVEGGIGRNQETWVLAMAVLMVRCVALGKTPFPNVTLFVYKIRRVAH